jgi:hypothetical protein
MERLQRSMIRIIFLRFNRRFKDGKEHRYFWNIVENKLCAGGKGVERQVLYSARSMTASARLGAN